MMILNNEVFLPISANMLDMENVIATSDDCTIPLKRTSDNKKCYDEMYRYLGKGSGFMFDIMKSQLNLVVRLNSIGQFDFFVSADFTEFRIEEVDDDFLSNHREKMSVVLLDEELSKIFPVLSGLFGDEPSIEDLRLQVVDAIPKEHMQDTMLFSEEITQKGYNSVWVSQDFKRCVLAFIEDVGNKNGLVKAYIY